MFRLLREYCVIRVSHVLNDETRFRGMSGKQIMMYTLANPHEHVRCYGEVVAVPDTLPDSPLYSKSIGAPAYSDRPPFWFSKASDIEMEIQVGDKAYFHYGALVPDLQINLYNHNFLGSEKIDGKMFHYFRVKYELIFAVVRYEKVNQQTRDFSWKIEGDLKENRVGNETLYFYNDPEPAPWGEHIYRKRVIMIGSYVFVRPDKETWESISIPIPETVNGRVVLSKDGRPMMKPKDQWLVRKSVPGNHYLRGWVAYVGTPLRGEYRHQHVKVGMYVYFRRYTDTPLMFEGEEFWRMRQNYISMIDPSNAKPDDAEQVREPAGVGG